MAFKTIVQDATWKSTHILPNESYSKINYSLLIKKTMLRGIDYDELGKPLGTNSMAQEILIEWLDS